MIMNLIEPAIPDRKEASVWQQSSRFIVCLFCGLPGRQVGDSLLCSNCLIDPVQTRIAIHAQLDGWIVQQVKVLETWETIRDAHADRWEKIQGAKAFAELEGTGVAMDVYLSKAREHRRAGNVYGLLLDAQAAYEQALEPLASERARLEHALTVLDQL